MVIRFFHPRHNGQWPPTLKDFLSQILSITLYFSYLNSWERASIFPFECSVPNKGTTGTIFITSLVWGGPWLGIETGTSRTRSQHYTTRLSRRRYCGLNPGPPALEASTISLGNRGGGTGDWTRDLPHTNQHYTTRLSRRRYWGLNPGPPALEASTTPLGYQGGGTGDWTRDLPHSKPALHH